MNKINSLVQIPGYKPNVFKVDCGSRRVLDLLADTWTVLVISAIKFETRRYGELQRMIEGISQKMLTQTLRKLERDGLLERTVYPVVPPKTEYKLTSLGQTLVKILEEMYCWAEDHLTEVEESRQDYDRG